MEKRVRSGYPSDVSDEEWSFVAPYLALCREDALQRDYQLRDVFNGLRYVAKTGNQWRFMPNDLPPFCRAQRPAHGHDSRQPHLAVNTGIRCARWLRWSQAPQGIEGSRGSGYTGPSAGLARFRRLPVKTAYVDQGYTGDNA